MFTKGLGLRLLLSGVVLWCRGLEMLLTTACTSGPDAETGLILSL